MNFIFALLTACLSLNGNWPEIKTIELVLQVIFQPWHLWVKCALFLSFKQIQDCPSDVRSADPTAKQIIRNSLQTEIWCSRQTGCQWRARPLPPSQDRPPGHHLPLSFLVKDPERSKNHNEKGICCAFINCQMVGKVFHIISNPRSNSDVHCGPCSRRRKLNLEGWDLRQGRGPQVQVPGCCPVRPLAPLPSCLPPLCFLSLFSFLCYRMSHLKNHIWGFESSRFIMEIWRHSRSKEESNSPFTPWSPVCACRSPRFVRAGNYQKAVSPAAWQAVALEPSVHIAASWFRPFTCLVCCFSYWDPRPVHMLSVHCWFSPPKTLFSEP